MEKAILNAAETKFGQVIDTQADVLLIKRGDDDFMTIKAALIDGDAQFNSGNYNMSLIEGALDLRDRATSSKTKSHIAYVVKLPVDSYTAMDAARVDNEYYFMEALTKQYGDALIQTLESFQNEFNEDTDNDEPQDYYIAFTNLINTGKEPV
jgi:hypothetical protein